MERNRLGAGARLSVVWQAGQPESTLDTVEHVASYARSLVEALTMAGWQPKRIEVGLRALPGVVELDVRGEVPRLDQASFAKLASVAIAACNLWAALDEDAEIRLRPRLVPPGVLAAEVVAAEAAPPVVVAAAPAALPRPEPASRPRPPRHAHRRCGTPRPQRRRPPAPTPAPAPVATAPAATEPADRPRLATRVIVALVFGGLLGLFGLPRLGAEFNLPGPAPAAQSLPTPAPLITTIPEGIVAATFAPTSLPVPTATLAPTAAPTALATVRRWRHEWRRGRRGRATARAVCRALRRPPRRLAARPRGHGLVRRRRLSVDGQKPGRFVAVGAPIARPAGDVMLSARFRKTGGPEGGGYGFIVRNQGTALDGDTQSGRYIVVEVGDRGDVGIWQRDDTRWIDVMPWTHSNAVQTGELPNELSVTTQGNRLKFVVNGVEVANMTHGSLPSDGGVGVFVGGDLNEVSLEWLIVEVPDTLVAR